MATQEVIESSLVWLYNKHLESHSETGDILQYVKSLGLSIDIQQVASSEVMGLTLGVLTHLKTSKSEYCDLNIIPALQNKDWSQICNLAEFLLKKKFVLVQGADTKLYARITQIGLQYLHASEATAC